MNSDYILDISWGAILKIAFVLLGFYFFYLIKDILTLIIFALIISVLFNPAIDFLEKKKISRVLSTILIYTAIFAVFGFSFYLIAPAFVSETQKFVQLFPQYFERVAPPLKDLGFEAFESFEVFTKSFQEWLIQASSTIFSAIASIFGGIFSAFTIFIIALFLSLEGKVMEKTISLIFPQKYETYVLNLWKTSQAKVSGWFGSKILGCLFVGLLTFLSCKILGIEYAFSFGILAGITNIILVVGPILAGIIIFILTILDSFWKAIFILIVFILIQQIEGNILTPVLTKKFIGLPPVLVLIALMIGGKLWGISGAVLSIPLVGILYEFLRNFLKKRKEESDLLSGQTPPPTASKKSIIW